MMLNPVPGCSCRVPLALAFAAGMAGATITLEPPPVATIVDAASLPSDDRAVAHLLNRITFGPRPGDVETVGRTGVQAYIDQQLHPERMSDAALESRLARFETLDLSTERIAEEYFLPARMERRERRRLEGEGTPRPQDNRPEVAPDDRSAVGQDDRSAVAPGNRSAVAPGNRSAVAPGNRSAVAPDNRSAVAQGFSPADDRPREPTDAMRKQRVVLAELTQQKLLRAVYSERQLQEVLVDFWFNHFNVFAGKGLDRVFLTSYERDVIRPRVFGTFRDLLGATAESPAMLFYLDNWMSADPNADQVADRSRRRPFGRFGFDSPARRGVSPAAPGAAPQKRQRGLNENYARELMELHTLGVDGGYTQKDVVEVARAFTGWTLGRPGRGEIGAFRFEPRMHDAGEKIVLGRSIPAGGGKSDGDRVLDILARHPSTSRFIATKLARRFVSDDPPSSLVDRAAARFRETDGDLREVVRTILTSPEFFAADASRAKVKTPLELVASALRVTGARVENALPLARWMQELGMPLYLCQPPTGYPDRADAWVNTGALVGRMNFAVALAGNQIRGVTVDLSRIAGAGDDLDAARRRVVRTVLLDDASKATVGTLGKAQQVEQMAALALGAPEFQRR